MLAQGLHHARVGTGIEISMDVTVTLSVIKGKAIGWPRGENADYIFTVGNARPLDQCLQHATTEMLRWLEQDYGLDPLSANLLISQCVRYDLGNMFDPAYTMASLLANEFAEASGNNHLSALMAVAALLLLITLLVNLLARWLVQRVAGGVPGRRWS